MSCNSAEAGKADECSSSAGGRGRGRRNAVRWRGAGVVEMWVWEAVFCCILLRELSVQCELCAAVCLLSACCLGVGHVHKPRLNQPES